MQPQSQHIVDALEALGLEDPQELRKLAEWYRAFAEVGDRAMRQSRLDFADYLERRADEFERRAADDPPER